MPGTPSLQHLAMGFVTRPKVSQLKRFVLNDSVAVELRKQAVLEITLRSSQKVTYLRTLEKSTELPLELRHWAKDLIAGTKVVRGGRAWLKRHRVI